MKFWKLAEYTWICRSCGSKSGTIKGIIHALTCRRPRVVQNSGARTR